MDTVQNTNRTRQKDLRYNASRYWQNYYPTGLPQGAETMFTTSLALGTNAEIKDVKGPNPFKLSRQARKLLRRLKVAGKRPPRSLNISRNDMLKFRSKTEASVDDLWLGAAGRKPFGSWGAVHIRGQIGPELFKTHTPDKWRPLGFDSVLSTSMERLIIAAFAKAKSPTLMVGEFAGTLKMTLDMFRRPLETSMNLLRSMFRKRNSWIKRGLTPAAALSAAWLEYRFGWRPLFLDFVKILEELDRKVLTFAIEPKIARAKEEIAFQGNYDLGTIPLDGRYGFDCRFLYDIKMTVRAGASYRLSFTGLEEYNRRFLGLRLHDILTTAWELVPWSWLVDYFLHIGNFLEAGLPAPEVTIGDYWASHQGSFKYKGLYSFNMSYIPVGCIADNAVTPFYETEWWDHNRYVNPTLSWIPQPDLNGLSSIQALNLSAAMFAKAFKAVPAIARR